MSTQIKLSLWEVKDGGDTIRLFRREGSRPPCITRDTMDWGNEIIGVVIGSLTKYFDILRMYVKVRIYYKH